MNTTTNIIEQLKRSLLMLNTFINGGKEVNDKDPKFKEYVIM